MKTLAYSYIRFSTSSQKQGRSYGRQMDLCIAWCAKQNSMELAEDTFFDEGKSGWSGEHLEATGQLKRFLDLVEAGKIARGSYLVIESLDRLSRQSVNVALGLFINILNADINIVTLMDNDKVYTRNFTSADVMQSVTIMARANEESETKSKRIKDDWQDKFALARSEGKKPVGRQVAKWIDLVKDGDKKEANGKPKMKYVENKERCLIVERVFRECIAGKGFVAVAQGLNNDSVPAFRGGTWCPSSIDDLLKNRCVLGEWEPKDGKGVIKGYFPVVIDYDTWESAQLAMEDRRFGRVTKQSKEFQVWQQVAQCGICGSTMNAVTKGKGSKAMDAVARGKSKSYRYLSCSNKRKGLCKGAVNVRREDSELVFKELLIKVGALGLIQTDAAVLEQQIRTLDGAILSQKQKLEQYSVAAAAYPESMSIYGLMNAAEQEIKRLEGDKAAVELKHMTQTIAQSDKAWLMANLPLTEKDERQRANALLRRLGVTVRVTGGEPAVYIAVQRGKGFLQLVSSEDDVVVVPLNAEQRERFAVQDSDGSDLAKVDEMLAGMGMYTKRHGKKT